MKFEYDPNKSTSNKIKHGIDFEQAQSLWSDVRKVEIRAKTVGESRFLLIAELDGQIWSAIYTIRVKTIRLISVRKSRNNEKEIYLNPGIR